MKVTLNMTCKDFGLSNTVTFRGKYQQNISTAYIEMTIYKHGCQTTEVQYIQRDVNSHK